MKSVSYERFFDVLKSKMPADTDIRDICFDSLREETVALGDDGQGELGLRRDETRMVFGTDRDQALINAIKAKFPNARNMFCVRHIYGESLNSSDSFDWSSRICILVTLQTISRERRRLAASPQISVN